MSSKIRKIVKSKPKLKVWSPEIKSFLVAMKRAYKKWKMVGSPIGDEHSECTDYLELLAGRC